MGLRHFPYFKRPHLFPLFFQFVPGKNVVEIIPASTVTTAAIIGYSDSSSNTTSSTESPAVRAIMCHEHIVSSLLLHDLVVIAAYFFGVYLFSRGETEYLFGLASHVSFFFLMAA